MCVFSYFIFYYIFILFLKVENDVHLFHYRSNINGPGTPRPLNRPKLSLSAPLTTNGLPESTDSKDSELQLSEEKGHRFVCFVFEEIEMHRNLRTVKGFIALFTIHKVEWTFYI